MNDMLERYFANHEVENKTESVIKALDICCPEYLSCDGCLYGIKHPNSSECVHALLKDARDLIIELEQKSKAKTVNAWNVAMHNMEIEASVPRGLGKSHASLGILE